jgi:hypothetical protein
MLNALARMSNSSESPRHVSKAIVQSLKVYVSTVNQAVHQVADGRHPGTKNATSTACGVSTRSRTDSYRIIAHTMYAIVYLATITRFVFKLLISKMPLELDDWLILATTLACIPGHVITEIGTTRNGLGKDVWTLTPTEISNVLMYLWAQSVACKSPYPVPMYLEWVVDATVMSHRCLIVRTRVASHFNLTTS